MSPTPTVPLGASQEYKKAFAILALKKGEPMTILVRRALDALYGEEISRELAPLLANNGNNLCQLPEVHSNNGTKNGE